jgi:hypothetical protein
LAPLFAGLPATEQTLLTLVHEFFSLHSDKRFAHFTPSSLAVEHG